MTKKTLKPRQVAPVQREINTTSSVGGGTGLTPHIELETDWIIWKNGRPFAGDDAE